MRIHNLYTDASGESHFRDIEVEWVEERRGSKLSARLPANGIIFRDQDVHCWFPELTRPLRAKRWPMQRTTTAVLFPKPPKLPHT